MKQVSGEGTSHLDPHTEDEMNLVGLFFERITEIYPDWPMGDRSDLAMAMIGVVKKWAHEDETSDSVRVVEFDGEEISPS